MYLRSRFPFILMTLIAILQVVGCSEDKVAVYLEQYETELKASEVNYEFIRFKVKRTVTLKDSLEEELLKAQQIYDRFAKKLDNEMDRSHSVFIANQNVESLRMAEEHLRSMQKFDSIRRSIAEQLDGLSKDENRVLRKEAIHTYKSNGILKQLELRFNEKDKLVSKGTPSEVSKMTKD